MYCDEMRIELAVPETQFLRLQDTDNWYYYFDLCEDKGRFVYFLTNELTYLRSRSSEFPFIIFANKRERESFNTFLINNQSLIDSIKPGFHGEQAKKKMILMQRNSVIDPLFIDKVLHLHQQWTAHNNAF